jgi:alkylhydroperoxidase family enzyme
VIERLADPIDELPLDGGGRALMAFCDRVRDASPTVDEADWARLRDAGWKDEAIVEAVHMVGMFSHFSRRGVRPPCQAS